MSRRPPRSTRTDTLFPCTTLFRSMAGGILNSYGRFAVPALSPVLMNLSMIAAALCLAPLLQSWGYNPVLALAWGVFVAGILQLAFQLPRSEEHTSELQSLMRISYAVFCLTKKPENDDLHATP